jgi:hypothetical protein
MKGRERQVEGMRDTSSAFATRRRSFASLEEHSMQSPIHPRMKEVA